MLNAAAWWTAACLVALIACLPGFGLAATEFPHGQRRIALVIGNAAYKEAPLRNPLNDARLMTRKLKTLGYDVIALENAGQARMNRAITEFAERLTDDGAAIFYYAGHAMQVKGRNFLIPVDAAITSEAALRNGSIDVDQVLAAIGDTSKRVNVVILDACRANPFGRYRGEGAGLAQISAPAGTLIAYSTAPGMTAADGAGKNSVYTAELARVLDDVTLQIEDVFKKVRSRVAEATGNSQIPWESSSLVGEFRFAPTVRPAALPPDREIVFWQSIQTSRNAADYSAYLERFPQGTFVSLAQARLADLQNRPADLAPPQPRGPAATDIVARAMEIAKRNGIGFPDHFELEPVADDVPPEAARFHGVWGPATFTGGSVNMLVVERIDADGKVHGIHAYSACCASRQAFQKGYQYFIGSIEGDQLTYLNRGGRKLTYRFVDGVLRAEAASLDNRGVNRAVFAKLN
jgi:Caspase domain